MTSSAVVARLSGCMPRTICPACGTNSSRPEVSLQNHRGGKWRRCLTCGSFFDSEAYDRHAEVLHMRRMPWGTAEAGTTVGLLKTGMYRSVLSVARRHCPPPAALFDVGCSFGSFLTEAREAGYSASGCDILPEAVEYVRALGIPAEVCFSIGDLTIVGNTSVDVMTCLDCNYYWPDQRFELRSAFTKLKPGGHLIMRVASKSWLCSLGLAISRIAPSIGKKILLTSVNDHRFAMPFSSLLKVIRETGFEVRYASPRGAISSSQSGPLTRLFFAASSLLWEASGIFAAPGALVVARKPSHP